MPLSRDDGWHLSHNQVFMTKQLRYYFNYIDQCNMCGSPVSGHRILGKRMNRSQGRNPSGLTGITTTIAKCTNCHLIYSNPQPVPFDIQDHYGIPPEDYWKDDYFVVSETYFRTEIETLKTLMEFKPGMKSLDIGAGLGKAMIAMAEAGFDTYGFEPSEQFYERAITKMGIVKEQLKVGMLENMEYPENHFEFITFGAVLEHLYDPSQSILKAMKWLKPGGIMHIEVPSSDWLINKIINWYYRLRLTDYVGNISPMHEPFHLHEFNLKSFQFHAQNYGYEIVHHEYYVCQTFMPRIADIFLKPYMKMTNKGMQLCVWLKKK